MKASSAAIAKAPLKGEEKMKQFSLLAKTC